MKRLSLLLIALVLYPMSIMGQTKLSDSRVTSEKNYIYKLDSKQLRDVYLNREEVGSVHLTNFVVAYGDKQPIPSLERGNYMIVRAVSGQLESVPHIVDDLFYNFIDTKKTELMLTDKRGVAVTGCRILAYQVDEQMEAGSSRRLKYDKKKGVYGAKIFKEPKGGQVVNDQEKVYVEIDNSGVYHYLELYNPYNSYPWLRNRRYDYNGRGGGYGMYAVESGGEYKYSAVVVSKPKYRPEDTVKLKAILMDKKGKPIKKSVDLYVEQNGEEKLLTQLEPFRDGAYSYEFALGDKELDFLTLNNYIGISLKDPKDSTLYAKGYFMYEDYELLRSSFTVRNNKLSYVFGDTVKLYVKATDDNGLSEIGGRVDVEITANANIYSNKFRKGYTYIPGVVWQETVYIDKSGEKEIVVPDSVIQKNIDELDYNISYSYLSVDNESKSEWSSFKMRDQEGESTRVDYEITADGLRLSVKRGEKELNKRATVKALRENGKVIDTMEIDLPATITPVWNAYKYVVMSTSEWAQKEIYIGNLVGSMIDLEFTREGKEVVLKVENPRGLEFVYEMVSGDRAKTAVKGNSRDKKYVRRVKNSKELALVLQYVGGGMSHTKKGQVYAQNREIEIKIDAPAMSYPGEKIDIEMEVLDGKKRPVYGADVTAYGVTSKFGVANNNGYVYADRAATEKLLPQASGELGVDLLNKLEWDRWRSEMMLEGVEYYNFAFPDEKYVAAEPARDGITQIAPFVVIDGVVQQAEVVYIDGVPYYYSGAEQVQPYSFAVIDGLRTIWMVTNSSYVQFTCDVKAGMKNIVSVDGAKSTESVVVKVREKAGVMTDIERRFIKQYMIETNDAYDYRGARGGNQNMGMMAMAHNIESDGRMYVVDKPNHYRWYESNKLLGPFPYKREAHYNLEGERLFEFNLLGGYRYNFQYKQPLVLTSIADDKLPMTTNVPKRELDFKEQVLSKADADSIELSRRNEVLKTQIERIVVTKNSKKGSGFVVENRWEGESLNLILGSIKGEEDPMSPLYLVVYKADGSEKHFHRGEDRTFYLDKGEYELEVVMENAVSYRERFGVRADGSNFLHLDQIETAPMERDMEREINSTYFHE